MSLTKQIEAVEKQRAALLGSMEEVVKAAEDEARPFTDEEQTKYDGMRKQLGDIDRRLENLDVLEKAAGARAQRVKAEQGDQMPAGTGARVTENRAKGTILAQLAHAMYVSGGVKAVAADYIQHSLKDNALATVVRAAVNPAVTGTPAWAGALVDVNTRIGEFIELLRAQSVYSRFPAQEVQFDGYGSITLKKRTTGISGGWVGENSPIPVKAGAFGSVTLAPKKMGVITAASKENLARSTPSLEILLRDSMLEDTAIVLDGTFVGNAASSSTTPAGLFHTSNASAVVVGSNTGVKADDALIDSEALLGALYTANVTLTRPVWLMHPAAKLSLMNLRSAVGNFYFRDEVVGGTWQGVPILESTTLPRTRLGLAETTKVVKGIGFSPEISVSDQATIQMDDAPAAGAFTSMFQSDLVALKLTMEASWVTYYTAAVQWINDLKW